MFVLSSGAQEWEKTAPRASLIVVVLRWIPLPCIGIALRNPAGLVWPEPLGTPKEQNLIERKVFMKPYMFSVSPAVFKMGKHTLYLNRVSISLEVSVWSSDYKWILWFFSMFVLRRKYSHLVLSKINTSGHVLGCSTSGSTSHLFKFLHVPSRWGLWAGARMWMWCWRGRAGVLCVFCLWGSAFVLRWLCGLTWYPSVFVLRWFCGLTWYPSARVGHDY